MNKKFKNKDLDYALPHLRLAGVTKIIVNFEGSGDSGEIQDIRFEPEKIVSSDALCPGKTESYYHIVEAVMYEYLNDKPDWYNNDGGHGRIQLNLMTRTLTCDLSIRQTHFDEYNYTNKF